MKLPESTKSRKRQRSESGDNPIQELDVQRENKRRRTTNGPLSVGSAIGNAFTSVYEWMFGRFSSPKSEAGTDDSSSTTMSKRSELNEGNDDIRLVHDTRRQDSKEVKNVAEEDEEVQFVGEVQSPQTQFDPPGHSTIIASTLKRTQPLFITTQEKFHKDKSDRRKPGYLISQIKQRNITARSQFESSPGLWKSKPFLDIPKPTFKRSFKTSSSSKTGTPKGRANVSMEQKMDFEKYKAILRGEGPYLYTVRSPTSPQRTPIFARSKGAYAPAAIERSYMKNMDGSKSRLGQMLDKFQLKKQQQAEVVNLADESDPIVSRPKCYAEDREDKDIYEILDIVSPPRSPNSKAKTPPSKNSLFDELKTKEVYQDNFLEELQAKYDTRKKDREVLIKEEEVKAKYSREYAERLTKSVEERMKKHLAITEIEIPEAEVSGDEEEEEESTELPEITPEMKKQISQSLSSPPNVTLVECYSIPIARKDLDTLRGLNWLNDEIINFYLNMIMARSKENDNWPNVHAFNTFFLSNIRTKGYASVKRWTRKFDLFSFDIILVPVHLDVHWCLAVINLKEKSVKFYDSMGSDKPEILKVLLGYIEQEHMDKKKAPFDTSDFELENVKDIPRQMNGSDCGMFTLKYSEYLSRNASITFTQEDMPYYRQRMVYEIVNNKIIHP